MADSLVAITAGAGTNIDTRTESTNSHHRQVVVIGDPSTNAGVCPVDATAGQKVDLGIDNDVRFAVVSATHFVAAASTNATSVKASAGTVYGLTIFNNATYPIFFKLHNTAGTPTAGSGVVRTFGVQAGTLAQIVIPQGGLSFATGIGFTIVTGLVDSNTTVTVANDAVGELYWV